MTNMAPRQENSDEFAATAVPSITELKQAIPAHCFKSSLAKSMTFVLKDLTISLALFSIVFLMDRFEVPLAIRGLMLPIYWFLQGTMMWAMFVLAHECGHGSFSKYDWVNDTVGNLLNSLILVPYYPWKLSHRHHHKNTGNIDKDEIFYPIREKDSPDLMPVRYFGMGLGWFVYLVLGYGPRKVSHYNPHHLMFLKHASMCIVSICCNAAWALLVLWPYSRAFGFAKLLVHYIVPLMVFSSWLVVTTFLHHQAEGVLWYADEKWDYVRGQLSSVDRHYGWAHELVHNIGTHQIHHLFPKVPHYHLEEATASFRQAFPDLVRASDASIWAAFVERYNIYMKDVSIPNDRQVHVFGGKPGMKEE